MQIYQSWNSCIDILVQDATPLLPSNNPTVLKHSSWAYSINTANGFFHKSVNSSLFENDDLLLTTENSTKTLFKNITVWPHKYYPQFMIVTLHETKQTIIIDSRGIPFTIDCRYSTYCYDKDVFCDKENGCFIIDNSIIIKYRSPKQQELFIEQSKPIAGAVFNKKYNSFIRANAKNTLPYLYLTASHSKCGMFIRHFIDNGMDYEIVPNMFIDDDSLNIRIPLFGQNLSRIDVQYLYAKHKNTYAIYNVPLEIAAGLFAPASKFHTYVPEDKECLSRSIFNTLCAALDTNDKGKIYQKTVAKILRLFSKTKLVDTPNKFLDQLLLHPNDMNLSDSYIKDKALYIAQLLSTDIDKITIDSYYIAYPLAKQRYKNSIMQYESEIQRIIVSNGGSISRWKNESHLYALVSKLYPDAIYQYHSEWLGLLSLDIFIPSLSLGIEYQGEQHYRPINFFGGEKSFEETVKRDKRKLQLCLTNNTKILYWKYDELITPNTVKARISDISQ